MPDETPWVDLYNPDLRSWHRVPDNLAVIQHFQDRGWETPEESAERAAAEAEVLRGRALEKALDDAGLPKTGTADEKRKALAEHAAAQALEIDPADQGATTDNEGEQPNG
jgi:hypothetical protein